MGGQCLVITMTEECFWHSVDGVQNGKCPKIHRTSPAQAMVIMSRMSLVSLLKNTGPDCVIFLMICYLLEILCYWSHGVVIEPRA